MVLAESQDHCFACVKQFLHDFAPGPPGGADGRSCRISQSISRVLTGRIPSRYSRAVPRSRRSSACSDRKAAIKGARSRTNERSAKTYLTISVRFVAQEIVSHSAPDSPGSRRCWRWFSR